MLRYFVPVLIFGVLAVFFFGGLKRNPNAITSPLIGKQIPEFSLPSIENPERMIGSADLERNGVTLLNVWGSWCIECRYEHPFLLELAETSGIPIYGLNLNDSLPEARSWLATLGDPYVASAFDEDGVVAIDWGVYGAPETFLIDRDGRILHKHITPLTPAVWKRDFMPLIESACADQPCAAHESR
jgi:cytochrome c biogenesis protein CcmG, thiol:disulfide interchange protein DsbE